MYIINRTAHTKICRRTPKTLPLHTVLYHYARFHSALLLPELVATTAVIVSECGTNAAVRGYTTATASCCMHCCSALLLLLLLLRGCCDENLSLPAPLAAAKTSCSYLETVDYSVKAPHQAVI
jgi:hypothetical protein